MTDIKELAHKITDATDTYFDGDTSVDVPTQVWIDEFATRLIAAYLDGCVVVPREPTLEMVIAGENYIGRHAYKAMIAAWEKQS